MTTEPLSLNQAGSKPYLHDHADHTGGHVHPPEAPGTRGLTLRSTPKPACYLLPAAAAIFARYGG